MLVVTDLQGNTEGLTDIKGAEVVEEVNGNFSFSFTSFLTEKNSHSFPLVQEESIVELNGHEFRIKKMSENPVRKIVFSSHIFFDLIGNRQDTIFGGTKTIDEFVSFALSGTGWTFENVDVEGSVLIPNFGNDNVVALIRKLANYFQCEVKIEPGKHLRFSKQIGPDTDEQFRYGHNLKTLKRNIDTNNLYTIIKGYGGNGLEVTYRSPMADIYGERYADPVRDENYTIHETMIERLKQELHDVPEVSIDVEASELDFQTELGMRLWLIHEKLGIDFKTRIMTMKWFPFSKRSPVVTVSNRKKSFTDLLTETNVQIKENQKETRSRFDQTNEKITQEVERVNESIGSLQIQADDVTAKVEELDTSVGELNIKSDNVTISVQSLDSRVGNAEGQLSVQSGMISSKVSYGDVMSAIIQSPESVLIDAGRLDLNTIVRVNEELQLGYGGNTGTKAIKFNGYDTWIYTSGDGLVLDSLGTISFTAPDVNFSNTTVTGLYAVFG